jgi:cation diffusion facilitator CzcD-associated flavoprotein CzcO
MSNLSAPPVLPATDALKEVALKDLALFGYPNAPWLVPALSSDDGLADIIIVGGGQTGVMAAASLKWDGLGKVAILDAAPAGSEGPWTTFARMAELRTSKMTVGMEFNIANLSVQRWFETRYGAKAWAELTRIPRTDWKAYLDWYAEVFDLEIENDSDVVDIGPDPAGVAVTVMRNGETHVRRARAVILATGFDGAGAWQVPTFVSNALPRHRYDHTNGPIDLAGLKGKRVGVLGHGASAFDNAIAALEAGARSVDLCFRRAQLPRTNPHRAIENAALMTHYPDLADLTKWQIAHYFRQNDQPPAVRSFETAMALSGFTLRPDSAWFSVHETPSGIRVATPQGELEFDHLLLATGLHVDLALRPELASLKDRIVLWRDRFTPPADLADDRLAQMPYLDQSYGFMARSADDAWVERVFAFNSCSMLNHGPHSTSISGHRHCLPRLIRGVERRILLDNEAGIVSALTAYRSNDLPISDTFEADLAYRLAQAV